MPFWAKFNVERSAEGLERYLDAAEPYDEIDLMLFSHGVVSLGLASIERWRSVLACAGSRGRLLGVDPNAYPADFATFARYHPALRRLPSRCPMPDALTLGQLAQFVTEFGARFPVEWHGLGADREPAANASDRCASH